MNALEIRYWLLLREEIARLIADHITGDSADWTEWECADAIMTAIKKSQNALKIELDNVT